MNKIAITDQIVLLLDSRGYGGIESHVLQLATALQHADYQVSVVLMRNYGAHPLTPALAPAGVRLVALNRLTDLIRLFLARPRLVHSHGYKAGILARVLGALIRTPVVSTFHAGEPGRGRLFLYNLIDRLSAPLAPAMAVSDQIATALPCPARVVANFVPVAQMQPPEGTKNIAFVGRLCHDKGADRFCQLAQQHPHAEFAIYGDGPDRDLLHNSYGQRVRFHGAVPDMAAYWSDIDLLCITSRHEGLPLVAIEAMSRGIPVLAFAVGDLPKLINHGDNGWLVAAGDLATMTTWLQHWQQLPASERAKISHRARQTVANRFSPRAVLPQIIDVYRQAAPALAQCRAN